jgi:hypothetical protein
MIGKKLYNGKQSYQSKNLPTIHRIFLGIFVGWTKNRAWSYQQKFSDQKNYLADVLARLAY